MSDHPIREEIFDTLSGVGESMSASEVAAAIGKPLSLAKYHLGVLERERRIEVDSMRPRAGGSSAEPAFRVCRETE